VEVNPRNEAGQTPVHIAARDGHVLILKSFLQDERVDVNCREDSGWSALSRASYTGNQDVVQVLLDTGRVEPNLLAALHCAVIARREGVVEPPLACPRLDVNAPGDGGRSALAMAISRGCVGIVKDLL
ncbi:ankyrin, partial [Choiromyces venosus 120613-1]